MRKRKRILQDAIYAGGDSETGHWNLVGPNKELRERCLVLCRKCGMALGAPEDKAVAFFMHSLTQYLRRNNLKEYLQESEDKRHVKLVRVLDACCEFTKYLQHAGDDAYRYPDNLSD